MPAQPYKVFISDLHAQGDMFDALTERRFGILEALLEDYARQSPGAPLSALRHYLLGEEATSPGLSDHFAELTAMMEILLRFKQDRRFWPVGVETFASCSWFLNILDEYAINGVLDDQRRDAIALLDYQDREQLCRYIAKAVLALACYRLHVVGDIFDRGPDAAKILDRLQGMPDVTIQWGNHDVLWMGAASGSLECIATVVRLCLKYGHIETLTRDYGINLNNLAQLARDSYACEPAEQFSVGSTTTDPNQPWEAMHKAIAVLQFKLEEQIIERNPNFALADRAMLKKVDFSNGFIILEGESVGLSDTYFPTVNSNSTSALTDQEWSVIEDLKAQFVESERLQKHINFLFANGSLLASDGRFVMFHGCLPVNEDLKPAPFQVNQRELSGRALFDAFELQLRKAYSRRGSKNCLYLSDIAWYLWCGPLSPLFGRNKMTTFERYFVADKRFHDEGKNPYFNTRDNQTFIASVAKELGGDGSSVIVNGHLPVKLKDGESPRFANGHLVCVDGGFSGAYRDLTGVAGMVFIADADNTYLFSIHERSSNLKFQLI
ncbi:fructose-bisphosphatase class III [Gilvimarinus sp. DA14]|uniref:fructose-bisphosphatase class III n=1 Tax=Gilvimarinus sp. DA14 TaxID=2956798 RepID=UPI0020B6E672|nr:fructose-bisphosphatase class III [Gilvimarinus sp. DA14]UTF61022.1 fructose-1,6-bisphosphatase [Gilvimarinus sp. DA14]